MSFPDGLFMFKCNKSRLTWLKATTHLLAIRAISCQAASGQFMLNIYIYYNH